MAAAIEVAKELLNQAGPGGEQMFATDDRGWDQATVHGLAAEKAVREVGSLLAQRAEHLAADQVAEIDARWSNELGAETVNEYAERQAQEMNKAQALCEEYQRRARAARDTGDEETAAQLWEQSFAEGRRRNELALEAHAAIQGTDPWSKERNQVLADAYRQVVTEQRPLGVPAEGLVVHPSSQKPAVRRLEQALGYYPTNWIEESNKPISSGGMDRFLRVRTTRGRAHYAHHTQVKVKNGGTVSYEPVSELLVDTAEEGCQDKGISTAIHEFGHRAEQINPKIADLERTFLARRTTVAGERDRLVQYHGKRSGPLKASSWTGKGEWVRPDDFLDQYVGKTYGPTVHAREVFSMGMEGVFAGRFGAFRGNRRYKADAEHRDLVLGILASV